MILMFLLKLCGVLKDGADFDSVRVYYDDKSYDKLSKGDFVEFVALKNSDRVELIVL